MQKRNMDEMISYFNRKVADMDIELKYKMELLCMITAIGIEYELQKQKTGKWIKAQYPFEQCSICGAYFDTASNEANYCCVCGTRME